MKWEEFKKLQRERYLQSKEDALTGIECPVCRRYIYEQRGIVLASYPPQHVYYCKNCDWSGSV